jgi:hypothetical protein
VGEVVDMEGNTFRWNRESCFAEAQRHVFGDDLRYAQLNYDVDVIRNRIVSQSMQDPVYLAAIKQWKSCMAHQNLIYEQPGDAAGALVEAYKSGAINTMELRRQEINIATADAECYRQAHLPQIRKEVQLRIEQTVKDEHAEVLAGYRAMHSESLQRVQTRISASSNNPTHPSSPEWIKTDPSS